MKKSEGYVSMSGEDDSVGVRCPCTSYVDDEPDLSVGGGWVTRCPKCGRGFRTEIVLWLYNPGEKDPEILDKDEFYRDMEENKRKMDEKYGRNP